MKLGKWKPSYKKLDDADLRGKMINGDGNGKESDLLKYWEYLYKEKGWNKYAAYNKKAGFNDTLEQD